MLFFYFIGSDAYSFWDTIFELQFASTCTFLAVCIQGRTWRCTANLRRPLQSIPKIRLVTHWHSFFLSLYFFQSYTQTWGARSNQYLRWDLSLFDSLSSCLSFFPILHINLRRPLQSILKMRHVILSLSLFLSVSLFVLWRRPLQSISVCKIKSETERERESESDMSHWYECARKRGREIHTYMQCVCVRVCVCVWGGERESACARDRTNSHMTWISRTGHDSFVWMSHLSLSLSLSRTRSLSLSLSLSLQFDPRHPLQSAPLHCSVSVSVHK